MGDGLMVQHASLERFGSDLVTAGNTLKTSMATLNSNAAKITDAWADSNGVITVEIFQKFIADSQPINDDLVKLGTYAQTSGNQYVSIESTRAGNMV